jgi:hypothetical protein
VAEVPAAVTVPPETSLVQTVHPEVVVVKLKFPRLTRRVPVICVFFASNMPLAPDMVTLPMIRVSLTVSTFLSLLVFTAPVPKVMLPFRVVLSALNLL